MGPRGESSRDPEDSAAWRKRSCSWRRAQERPTPQRVRRPAKGRKSPARNRIGSQAVWGERYVSGHLPVESVKRTRRESSRVPVGPPFRRTTTSQRDWLPLTDQFRARKCAIRSGGHLMIPGSRPSPAPGQSWSVLLPTSETSDGPCHLSEPGTMTFGHHAPVRTDGKHPGCPSRQRMFTAGLAHRTNSNIPVHLPRVAYRRRKRAR